MSQLVARECLFRTRQDRKRLQRSCFHSVHKGVVRTSELIPENKGTYLKFISVQTFPHQTAPSMFNGIDPPPPYERNPPRDPPPPPTPVYPQLTAPTFRLSDCPIFPVTRMDDPDLKNLNAYRQLDYKEFVRPPGRRVDQTHYAIVIGSRLGVTANLYAFILLHGCPS